MKKPNNLLSIALGFVAITSTSLTFTAPVQAAGMYGSTSSTWTNAKPNRNVNKINVDILGYNSITWGTGLSSGLGFKSKK